jgi:DNA-binding response OmpR family regulator
MATVRQRSAHILLVEDDAAFAAMVRDALQESGHVVWHVERGEDAELALDHLRPDLIVLDLMLPDRNGLLLCGKLKTRADAPVIICSATKRKDDGVIGLQLGADDFLRKPFSLDELQTRIQLALRRGSTPPPRKPDSSAGMQGLGGALNIDSSECKVTLAGEVLRLTPTEYRLLVALVHRAPEVLSRNELAEGVWDCVDDGVLRSLDVHMRRLRLKLRGAGANSPQLLTRRGFGYQLIDVAKPRPATLGSVAAADPAVSVVRG